MNKGNKMMCRRVGLEILPKINRRVTTSEYRQVADYFSELRLTEPMAIDAIQNSERDKAVRQNYFLNIYLLLPTTGSPLPHRRDRVGEARSCPAGDSALR